jgi:hypothetical protein
VAAVGLIAFMKNGKSIPFFRLQDMTRIELYHGATEEEILSICRERCRSDHVILIDDYKEIPDSFMFGRGDVRGGQRGFHAWLPHFQEASLSGPT